MITIKYINKGRLFKLLEKEKLLAEIKELDKKIKKISNPEEGKKFIDENGKKWRKIKEFFSTYTGEVCWYCEGDTSTQYEPIEHFRPKKKITNIKSHEGYWWLAFDVENYRLSCQVCNSNKGNYFDIFNEDKRVYNKEDDIGSENPKFLDPFKLKDIESICFNFETGEMISKPSISKDQKEKVRYTNEKLKLSKFNEKRLDEIKFLDLILGLSEPEKKLEILRSYLKKPYYLLKYLRIKETKPELIEKLQANLEADKENIEKINKMNKKFDYFNLSGYQNKNYVYIEDVMKQSYLGYSMKIIGDTFPDVRDGLNPIHRRILFTMNELGINCDKPYKKSAKIVGEVLGKYHPYGDTLIYNTVIKMAQEFNYRYQLIEGQGNFGFIAGDSATTMRYTEIRMSQISGELLGDIEKDTINFIKNFDNTLYEPEVFPAKLPNLLLNGARGIALGIETNIPPHNLGEIIDGIVALIEDKNMTSIELMEYIKGPDFPTGGIIEDTKGIADAYTTGTGVIEVRAKIEIEEHKNEKINLIIKEIPYGLNKLSVIKKIICLVKENEISEIVDLRDESARGEIRIVVELKNGEKPEIVLNKLYRYTELQRSYNIKMYALTKSNRPQILTLKEILIEYLEHRFEVVRRRICYDIKQKEDELHLKYGLRTILNNIDEIIEILKNLPDENCAKEELMREYMLSETQVKIIIEMKLQKLISFEKDKVESEIKNLETDIITLSNVLTEESKIYEIIKNELKHLKNKYVDKRKTIIEEK